jgi:hypothetical protein
MSVKGLHDHWWGAKVCGLLQALRNYMHFVDLTRSRLNRGPSMSERDSQIRKRRRLAERVLLAWAAWKEYRRLLLFVLLVGHRLNDPGDL